MIGSLLGNALVIRVIQTNRSMRTSTNLLIRNIAYSDIIMTLLFLPTQIAQLYIDRAWLSGLTGAILCKAVNSFRNFSFSCSIISLLAIAFGRFFAVVNCPSNQCRFLTADRLRKVIWFISAAVGAPTLSLFKQGTFPDGKSYCYMTWATDLLGKAYVGMVFVLMFVLPLLVMSVLYSVIYYKGRFKRRPEDNQEFDQWREARRTINTVRMMSVVVAVFCLCWAPIQIYFVLRSITPHLVSQEGKFWGLCITTLISNTNLLLNPFMFPMFNKKFRDGFKQVWSSHRRPRTQPYTNSRPVSFEEPSNSQHASFMDVINSRRLSFREMANSRRMSIASFDNQVMRYQITPGDELKFVPNAFAPKSILAETSRSQVSTIGRWSAIDTESELSSSGY